MSHPKGWCLQSHPAAGSARAGGGQGWPGQFCTQPHTRNNKNQLLTASLPPCSFFFFVLLG